MQPPQTINVLDRHNGFTAITREKTRKLIHNEWRNIWREGSTLWRPSSLLRHGTTGMLCESNDKSFYQTNDNVTQAIYKVKGYGYRVAVWFDNVTGERIA